MKKAQCQVKIVKIDKILKIVYNLYIKNKKGDLLKSKTFQQYFLWENLVEFWAAMLQIWRERPPWRQPVEYMNLCGEKNQREADPRRKKNHRNLKIKILGDRRLSRQNVFIKSKKIFSRNTTPTFCSFSFHQINIHEPYGLFIWGTRDPPTPAPT